MIYLQLRGYGIIPRLSATLSELDLHSYRKTSMSRWSPSWPVWAMGKESEILPNSDHLHTNFVTILLSDFHLSCPDKFSNVPLICEAASQCSSRCRTEQRYIQSSW